MLVAERNVKIPLDSSLKTLLSYTHWELPFVRVSLVLQLRDKHRQKVHFQSFFRLQPTIANVTLGLSVGAFGLLDAEKQRTLFESENEALIRLLKDFFSL